jgi:hypothetical protein
MLCSLKCPVDGSYAPPGFLNWCYNAFPHHGQYPQCISFWFICFVLCSAFFWRWMISPHCITAAFLSISRLLSSQRKSFSPFRALYFVPLLCNETTCVSPLVCLFPRPFPPCSSPARPPRSARLLPAFPRLARSAVCEPRVLPGPAVKDAMVARVDCRAVHDPGILGMIVHFAPPLSLPLSHRPCMACILWTRLWPLLEEGATCPTPLHHLRRNVECVVEQVESGSVADW